MKNCREWVSAKHQPKIKLNFCSIFLFPVALGIQLWKMHQMAQLGRKWLSSVCQGAISWSTQNHSLALFIAAKREKRKLTISPSPHTLNVTFPVICLPSHWWLLHFKPTHKCLRLDHYTQTVSLKITFQLHLGFDNYIYTPLFRQEVAESMYFTVFRREIFSVYLRIQMVMRKAIYVSISLRTFQRYLSRLLSLSSMSSVPHRTAGVNKEI